MRRLSDPYRTLGVPRDATLPQIKAAHRKLAKRYHPDSPTADQSRFLGVQEAYQVLSDPLLRREWDARHAPAPMRADEPGSPAGRPRSRRAAPSNREQAARNYTWSASEVPWWEEGSRRSGRRPPAARPPAAEEARPTPDEPVRGTAERADFDVYNRSSGAAWSAAARAYFRRADQDLPRRGSFQYQGSQPLTAARARAAAEDEARRQARSQAQAPPARPATPGTARPTSPRSARSAAPAAPAPEAGVARDAEGISRARARVRAAERAARWPSSFQRVRYALLAWVPVALLVGYGGPVVADCRPGLGGCPDYLVPAQVIVALAALIGLLLAPRLAYAGALATTALALTGGAALLGAWLTGVRAPQAAALPPWALVVGSLLLAVAYVLVGAWLAADRQRRPWAAIRIRR